jgi:hypothetical protein
MENKPAGAEGAGQNYLDAINQAFSSGMRDKAMAEFVSGEIGKKLAKLANTKDTGEQVTYLVEQYVTDKQIAGKLVTKLLQALDITISSTQKKPAIETPTPIRTPFVKKEAPIQIEEEQENIFEMLDMKPGTLIFSNLGQAFMIRNTDPSTGEFSVDGFDGKKNFFRKYKVVELDNDNGTRVLVAQNGKNILGFTTEPPFGVSDLPLDLEDEKTKGIISLEKGDVLEDNNGKTWIINKIGEDENTMLLEIENDLKQQEWVVLTDWQKKDKKEVLRILGNKMELSRQEKEAAGVTPATEVKQTTEIAPEEVSENSTEEEIKIWKRLNLSEEGLPFVLTKEKQYKDKNGEFWTVEEIASIGENITITITNSTGITKKIPVVETITGKNVAYISDRPEAEADTDNAWHEFRDMEAIQPTENEKIEASGIMDIPAWKEEDEDASIFSDMPENLMQPGYNEDKRTKMNPQNLFRTTNVFKNLSPKNQAYETEHVQAKDLYQPKEGMETHKGIGAKLRKELVELGLTMEEATDMINEKGPGYVLNWIHEKLGVSENKLATEDEKKRQNEIDYLEKLRKEIEDMLD